MLLTGFESYGGRAINPAEQVVKRMAGSEIAGSRVEGHTLPVDYAELGPRIARLIDQTRPRAVICLGLWPGTRCCGSSGSRSTSRIITVHSAGAKGEKIMLYAVTLHYLAL